MGSGLRTSVLDLLGVFANGLLGGAVARSMGMGWLGWLPAVLPARVARDADRPETDDHQ